MTHGAMTRHVPRHNVGERIRQTKDRMAGKIPDGRKRRAHPLQRPGPGPGSPTGPEACFFPAMTIEQTVC